MSNSIPQPDRGPLDTYQIIWQDGRIEEIQAHQVTTCRSYTAINDGLEFTPDEEIARVEFHGEFDGRWKLALSAPAKDIRVIRRFPAGTLS
jgi:hypothetical protein